MPGLQSPAQRAMAQPPRRYADGGLVDDFNAQMEQQRMARRQSGLAEAAQASAWSESEAQRAMQQLPDEPQAFADGGPVGFGARGLAGLRDLVPKMAAMGYPQAAAPAPAPAADPRGAAGLRAMIPQVEAMGYKQASAPAPQYFARGGVVRGPGTGTSDSIETEAEPGTFIMPADSTEAIGPSALEQMGTMPVRLSDGEYQMPPEQVMALGAAVLKAMKDATHTPVNGEDGGQTDAEIAAQRAPTAEEQMAAPPRQAFADGGDVQRVGNSYSGMNIGGAITVNGAAPRGTYNENPAGFAPSRPSASPAPAPVAATPTAPSYQQQASRLNTYTDPRSTAYDPNPFATANAAKLNAPAGIGAPAATATASAPPPPAAAPVQTAARASIPASMPAAPTPLAASAAPAPMGWAERNAQRNAEVSAASIMNRPEWSRTPLAQQRMGQMPNAPAGFQPRRFADGGMVEPVGYFKGGLVGEEEERRRQEQVQQIPTGGQPIPVADGSQNNPLNNEVGRNVVNTLSALPGAGGLAARGGATAARTAGAVANTERAIPAAWELVEGGGALANRAAAPAAQQMAQLPSAGGPMARAAGMAPQQAAPALSGPAGQLATQPAGLASRGATEFVERVPDAALAMSQTAAPAGLAARGGASGVGRYAATGAAGMGAAAMLAGASPDGGASPTQPAGFSPGAGAGRGVVNPPLVSPSAPGPSDSGAPAGFNVTRQGNSYSGSNVSGDISIGGDGPRGGGQISAQNMGAADALAGRQAQESAARVLGQMPAGFQGAVQAPTVLHSGNSWQERNDLRNALVSASSITANGGRFDRNKGESAESLTYRAMLGNDIAARGAVPKLAGEAMAQNSETNRATLRERSLAAQGAANRDNDLNRTLITERGNNTRAGIAADATTEAARARAAAAGQKPATEAERTAAGYTQRMIEATKYIDQFEDTGKASYTSEGARSIPKIGGSAARAVMSKEQEQYRQGQEDWVRAKLRKESGAVIGDQEMQREIETYFPMPGESPEVIQQKKASRAVAIDAMRTNAGTALPERYNQSAAPAASAPAAGVPPQISELQRRAANNPALAARLKELGY